MKDPPSSSSSVNRRPLVVLAPRGFSCWMMCMSDVTEWDTPLQRRKQSDHEGEKQRYENSSISYRMTSIRLFTSSCQDPCPVSQLALSSSPLIPSTSAPQFSSAAQDLYRPIAGTECWGGRRQQFRKVAPEIETQKYIYWPQKRVENHQRKK